MKIQSIPNVNFAGRSFIRGADIIPRSAIEASRRMRKIIEKDGYTKKSIDSVFKQLDSIKMPTIVEEGKDRIVYSNGAVTLYTGSVYPPGAKIPAQTGVELNPKELEQLKTKYPKYLKLLALIQGDALKPFEHKGPLL